LLHFFVKYIAETINVGNPAFDVAVVVVVVVVIIIIIVLVVVVVVVA